MNDHQDSPQHPCPDPLRRRLIKGGFAAPVVLTTLASKPVLGAATHNCTISGQLSGNISTHIQGTCTLLGKSPQHYGAMLPVNWPNAVNDFLVPSTGFERIFLQTPNSLPPISRFVDAYEMIKISGGPVPPVGTVTFATVRSVLVGYPIDPYGNIRVGWELRVKSGFYSNITLGSEAIAAYMNAYDATNNPDYPLTPVQVVSMFNAVVSTSSPGYLIAPGVYWSAVNVLNYWQSLHT